jgi:crotonobetainyl-CoA:carnitine CoA-transferase CaiB-like acyl-CoA transferase
VTHRVVPSFLETGHRALADRGTVAVQGRRNHRGKRLGSRRDLLATSPVPDCGMTKSADRPPLGTATAWAALGGNPALLGRVTYRGPCPGPGRGPGRGGGLLGARLPVMPLARSCVAACSLAAAELAARRTGRPFPAVAVDDAAVAAAFVSERHLRVAGRAPESFAPLSRFWRTDGGWIRTHANYPHHRARLLAALGIPDSGPCGPGADEAATVDRVAAELAGRAAEEVQETVYAAGGLAVAVREPGDWAAHPQGRAVAAQPLLALERTGDGPPRPAERLTSGGPGPLLPAAGLRVLDLTRVIAGPVATRTLALLGADVLRIDAPQLPELKDQHADTGFGKRSAALDLGSRADRDTFEELLSDADVVVTGYRPGALDRYGLAPHALAERRPGLIVARLSAWGTEGPWADRRGFDSLVQAACGIAAIEAGPDGRPGALPAQALDHGTGYLLAAAVLRARTEQLDTGGGRLATLALASTAGRLLAPAHGAATHGAPAHGAGPHPVRAAAPPYDAGERPAEWLAECTGPLGPMRYARPPVFFAGAPADWSRPPGVWGTDAPSWSGG